MIHLDHLISVGIIFKCKFMTKTKNAFLIVNSCTRLHCWHCCMTFTMFNNFVWLPVVFFLATVVVHNLLRLQEKFKDAVIGLHMITP